MSTDDRKRRTDAWDAQLTEEQQAQVYDRLRKFPWHEVAPWVAESFGVPAPSRSSLYRFREWFCDHEAEYLIRQRLADNALLTRELEQVGAPDPEKLSRAFANDVAAARARGDEEAVARAVRAFKTVASIVGDTRTFDLKVKEFEQARKEFSLAEARFEVEVCERFLSWFREDRAREIAESTATNADKIAALRQAYFRDVDELEKSGEVKLPQ